MQRQRAEVDDANVQTHNEQLGDQHSPGKHSISLTSLMTNMTLFY
jgi:hypothetical protein